jgi:hypothetical protein
LGKDPLGSEVYEELEGEEGILRGAHKLGSTLFYACGMQAADPICISGEEPESAESFRAINQFRLALGEVHTGYAINGSDYTVDRPAKNHYSVLCTLQT